MRYCFLILISLFDVKVSWVLFLFITNPYNGIKVDAFYVRRFKIKLKYNTSKSDTFTNMVWSRVLIVFTTNVNHTRTCVEYENRWYNSANLRHILNSNNHLYKVVTICLFLLFLFETRPSSVLRTIIRHIPKTIF